MGFPLNIYVLTWKDSNSNYFPNGVSRQISCNHINEGTFGVSIRGEVFPLPQTQILPAGSPPTYSPPIISPPSSDYNQETVMVLAGSITKPVYPFSTADANFKICIKLKDMTTLITYYVDATDYTNKIVGCNLSTQN